jgi:hypothetical protein
MEQGELTGEGTDALTATVGAALRAAGTQRAAGTLRILSAMAPSARTNGFAAQADAITGMLSRPVTQLSAAERPAEEPAQPATNALRAFRMLSSARLSGLAAELSAGFADQPPDAVMTVPEPDTALPPGASMGDDPGSHLLEFGVPVNPDTLRQGLAQALDPGPLLAARLDSIVTVTPESPVTLPATPADPVMACPDFPAPMAMALKDAAPDWFLPGSTTIPDDRAVLLQANAPFIASFMVGVNDELNREMRWREYPTDLRGSPFTHFWPRPDGQPDIPPVHSWTPQADLRAQLTLGAGELDVLLIRGLLIRRYPNLVVAAVPVASVHESGDLAENTWEHPKMVLNLDERTCAYAFELPGDIHDWWFVLAENSYRMRFGFDTAETGQGRPPTYERWSDLTWTVGDGGFADLGVMPAVPDHETVPDRWNAATVAMVALQRPFRVVTSARSLIGDPR